MVNEGSLQEDLLAIPGVEGAEVEGSADKPAGLRIRIAEGADQQAVGGAIRRVLTSHGLGTDTRLPGEASAQSGSVAAVPDVQASEAAGGGEAAVPTSAVAVADEDEGAVIDLTERATESSDSGEAPSTTSEAPETAATPSSPEPEVDVSEPLVPPPDEVETVVERTPAPEPVEGARLASVAVEEGRDGIVVTVASTDGTSVQQVAASTEGGVESAVVKATVRLALPDAPDASVIDVDDRRVEGVDIVMIVLDVDGHVYAGSSVVGAGRSFALGRATWAALTI